MPSRALPAPPSRRSNGSAYGYFLTVGLFGGPPNERGPAPTVTIPPAGGNESATLATAAPQVGPAIFFEGTNLNVNTQGTTGPSGSVTSTSTIGDISVERGGAFDAGPSGADPGVTSTCTTSETGAVSGSVTINNGVLETDSGDDINDGDFTDPGEHAPVAVALPLNPEPNTFVPGHIHVNSVQEDFVYIFNEQVTAAGPHRLRRPSAHRHHVGARGSCQTPRMDVKDVNVERRPAASAAASISRGSNDMARSHRRNGSGPRAAALLGALVVTGAATFGSAASSGAQASGMSGTAFGHYTNVGLFGGPLGANGPAPMVTLPENGAEPALVATEPSAQAVYGPAKIFGGRWPPNLAAAPPSGPISVSVKGKPGAGGSVTSTADIALFSKPLPVQCDGEPGGSTNCTAPGGFGPNPPTEGDSLHSECTASASGTTGTTRLVNAILATATDPEGDPINEEPVPDNPPVNYTRTGQLTNVGDNFKIVYNEQIREPNGALTVNAVHMSLLGPIAVGEQILGQVRCSANGPLSPGISAPPSTTSAPATSAPAPSSRSVLPLVVGGAVALAALAGFVVWGRRRGAAKGAGAPDAPT